MGYKEDIDTIISDISSVILECESLKIDSLEYKEYHNRSNLIIERVDSIYNLSFNDNHLLNLLLLELKKFLDGLSSILFEYKKKLSLLEYYNLKYNLIKKELELILIEYKLSKEIFSDTFIISSISIHISYIEYHIKLRDIGKNSTELNIISNILYLNLLDYLEYIDSKRRLKN